MRRARDVAVHAHHGHWTHVRARPLPQWQADRWGRHCAAAGRHVPFPVSLRALAGPPVACRGVRVTGPRAFYMPHAVVALGERARDQFTLPSLQRGHWGDRVFHVTCTRRGLWRAFGAKKPNAAAMGRALGPGEAVPEQLLGDRVELALQVARGRLAFELERAEAAGALLVGAEAILAHAADPANAAAPVRVVLPAWGTWASTERLVARVNALQTRRSPDAAADSLPPGLLPPAALVGPRRGCAHVAVADELIALRVFENGCRVAGLLQPDGGAGGLWDAPFPSHPFHLLRPLELGAVDGRVPQRSIAERRAAAQAARRAATLQRLQGCAAYVRRLHAAFVGRGGGGSGLVGVPSWWAPRMGEALEGLYPRA